MNAKQENLNMLRTTANLDRMFQFETSTSPLAHRCTKWDAFHAWFVPDLPVDLFNNLIKGDLTDGKDDCDSIDI